MTYLSQSFIILAIIVSLTNVGIAQTNTNKEVLNRMYLNETEKDNQSRTLALQKAKKYGWPLVLENKELHQFSVLKGVDHFGFPIYVSTLGNISANTISTNKVWQQYSVSGSSANMLNKLAIWDGGTVYKTHPELIGRIIQKDSANSIHLDDNHCTHTTGTMIATGINPSVKGMSYATQQLIAYDFINDFAEVSKEAPNLLLSNHSYGTNTGWLLYQGSWFFYGNPDSLSDYKFGFYGQEAQTWDSISYNAPNYLIVQAAGNNRNSNGPAVGNTYQYYSPIDSSTILTGTRVAGINSNDSFNTIPTYANAKNIMTVGAVSGLLYGYTAPSDAVMANFSSWGPTSDGRIKPDLVADGVGVLSTVASSTTPYAVYNGTSMATPSVTGSLFLVQELYSKKHNGSFMRSASLKGLAIHTADEAGAYPGPDYKYGWGLMNTKKAADFVANNYNSDTIIEHVLNNTDTFRYSFVASGSDPVKATLAWTDAPANINYSHRYNNPETKLINDLDIKVVNNGTTYYPWVLNPNQPTQAAWKAVNNLDNVERVDIDTTIPGNLYTVIVTHKGNLQRGSQAFSLILSGINGDSSCTSYPTSNAGLTIDSLSVTNLHLKNTTGCTTYTDNRKYAASIEPHQNVAFTVYTGNCSGITNASSVVKVYVDYNHNGSYSDPGELVSTSAVLTGKTSYTSSFTTPWTLQPGTKTTMRIVVVETTDTSTVKPCGTYAKGETQDISLQVVAPSNDIAVTDIVAPVDSTCNGNTLLAVQLYNKGTTVQNKIPLTVVVKNGSTVISAQSVTCNVIVNPQDIFTYTLPASITLAASTTYTISAVASLANDQDTTNNSFTKTIATAGPVSTPSGIGEICVSNGYALLEVTNSKPGVNYFWYNSSTSDVPVASGTTANSNNIPADNTFYLTSGLNTSGIGLSSKNLFPGGGGYLPLTGNSNYIRYNSNTNVILQSAKLYTGYPGKITFVPTSSVAINVPATLATPVKGAYAVNDPADAGAVYSLNLPLTAGAHYIVISTDTSATVFCNNNVTGNPYPMGNQNELAILSNSAAAYQSNYLALYAMKFTSPDCPSARVTVVANKANPPVITHSHDTLFSSNLMNNQWFENGGPIFMANDYFFVVADSAVYTVSCSDSMGCTQTSNGFLFDSSMIFDTSHTVHDSLYGFTVYPIPVVNSLMGIRFTMIGNSDMKLSLFNPLGQLCMYKDYPTVTGNFDQQIWVGNLSSGVYYLYIRFKNATLKRAIRIFR